MSSWNWHSYLSPNVCIVIQNMSCQLTRHGNAMLLNLLVFSSMMVASVAKSVCSSPWLWMHLPVLRSIGLLLMQSGLLILQVSLWSKGHGLAKRFCSDAAVVVDVVVPMVCVCCALGHSWIHQLAKTGAMIGWWMVSQSSLNLADLAVCAHCASCQILQKSPSLYLDRNLKGCECVEKGKRRWDSRSKWWRVTS